MTDEPQAVPEAASDTAWVLEPERVTELTLAQQQEWVHRMTQARAALVDIRLVLAVSRDDHALPAQFDAEIRQAWRMAYDLDARLESLSFQLVTRRAS